MEITIYDWRLIDWNCLVDSNLSNLLKESVGNTFYPILSTLYAELCYEFLPNYIFDYLSHLMIRKVDLCISNVPGSKIPLIYCGSEVYDILSVINTGMIFSFSLVLSYNNKLRLLISLDKILGIDPQSLLKHIQKSIDLSISKLKIN